MVQRAVACGAESSSMCHSMSLKHPCLRPCRIKMHPLVAVRAAGFWYTSKKFNQSCPVVTWPEVALVKDSALPVRALWRWWAQKWIIKHACPNKAPTGVQEEHECPFVIKCAFYALFFTYKWFHGTKAKKGFSLFSRHRACMIRAQEDGYSWNMEQIIFTYSMCLSGIHGMEHGTNHFHL